MPIILTVLGFLWWWPIGLVLLGVFLGRGKFGCRRHLSYAGDAPMFCGDQGRDRWERKMTRLQEKMDKVRDGMDRFRGVADWFGSSTSGNRAFDDYRAETLKRLEEEQREFKDFLARLRFARDRAEFDQFMAERRDRPFEPNAPSEPPARPRD
jgi:erythromycin esterase-like protein